MQVAEEYLSLFRLSMPHLFSLLADDSRSPKMQDWLGNQFRTQLRGNKYNKKKKSEDRIHRLNEDGRILKGHRQGKLRSRWQPREAERIYSGCLSGFFLLFFFTLLHGITCILTMLLAQDVCKTHSANNSREKLKTNKNKPLKAVLHPSPYWMLIYSLICWALREVILTINL